MTLQEIEAALNNERLVVKVGKSWVFPISWRAYDFGDGTWMIRLRAGTSRRLSYITSISTNPGGREFHIIKESSK